MKNFEELEMIAMAFAEISSVLCDGSAFTPADKTGLHYALRLLSERMESVLGRMDPILAKEERFGAARIALASR